jgi:CelD/BcsL family acetyltransferase involved in cellulose biosynthesis
MCGTSGTDVTVFHAPALLPSEAATLLEHAGSVFASRSWWETVLSHAMPTGSAAWFVVVRVAGKTAAVLPMVHANGRLDGLTTPYTCEYTPLFASGLGRTDRIAAMRAFGKFCRGFGVVRLDALPADWDGLDDLMAGVQQAGSRPLRFEHFGNWYENVAGLDWSGYLLQRPGALRETIRRRLRRAEKLPGAVFDLLTQPADMDRASEAFESVYGRSWKDAEPFPTFNVALMRVMARSGQLRCGVWSVDAEPVAVQVWVVRDGHAIVLKLAHDEAFKAHSPGTVLTALMLRHLLDHEHVAMIDFGRGDDGYKQGWAIQRRQRIGLLLVNPWRLSGAMALLRHWAGRVRAGMR